MRWYAIGQVQAIYCASRRAVAAYIGRKECRGNATLRLCSEPASRAAPEKSTPALRQVPGAAEFTNGVVSMRLAPTALLLVLIASILAACSGSGGGCVANCSTGGSVSLVLTATPPAPTAALSIQAFTATITGITLISSAGGSP